MSPAGGVNCRTMTATSLLFSLAGLRTRLECAPADFAAEVLARFGPFIGPDDGETPADFTAQVTFVGAQARISDADLQVFLAGGECRFDTAAASGKLSLATRSANLTLRSTSPIAQMEYFLRILYALLAEAHGGLMLHCAGIMAQSGAHLFIGQSGSGKSTAASLSRGRGVVMNDDLIVLRPEKDCWIAYGTPFWNFETFDRDGQTSSAAVAGICTLIKDLDVYLEPLSTAAAVAALIGSCPVVNGDPGRALDLLTRCRQIVREVPVQQLHFRKDPSFWDMLEASEGRHLHPPAVFAGAVRTKDGG
jgi:hypothetical protein